MVHSNKPLLAEALAPARDLDLEKVLAAQALALVWVRAMAPVPVGMALALANWVAADTGPRRHIVLLLDHVH